MDSAAGPREPDEDAVWAGAVRELAARVLGDHEGTIRLLPSTADGREYSYEARGNVLTIRATDAISACVGLHRFLRDECGLVVHWDTELPLPLRALPDAPAVRHRSRSDEQYMFNFCTFGYTMAHWGWDDWQREIDWMALHGVTMPLAATGHEAALVDAFTALGVDEERMLEFLGAPVYLPFVLMGNLDGVGGGIDRRWLEERAELGRRILDRERALGMTPVLPSFTGHVPRELAPDDVAARPWQGFTSHVLDPEDPRFAQVAEAITRAQIARFGTDHLYASDPFIEMIPVDDDRDHPGRVGRSLLAGLTAADPEARWVLQSWPFSYQSDFWSRERVRAFLESIPRERLLILDLWAEQDPQWDHLDGFFGADWLWCGLLNFGGRTEPIADLQGAIDELERAFADGSAPRGVGLTMEATRNNPVFFELLADLAWHDVPDLGAWVARFAAERYGPDAPREAIEAWRALLETVYSAAGVSIFPEDFHGILTRRPGPELTADAARLRGDVASQLWYEPSRLLEALELLTRAAEESPALAAGPLGHDLLDTAVALFTRLIDALGADLAERRDRGDVDRTAVDRFLDAFTTLDRLLSCRPEFRMSSWESQAVEAATDAGAPGFVAAARRILTTWNDETGRELDDYAARVWHGLVGDYYRLRWEAWTRELLDPDPRRLEQELDELSSRLRAEGVAESALPPSALPGLARAALARHAPVFLEVVTRRPHDRQSPPRAGADA